MTGKVLELFVTKGDTNKTRLTVDKIFLDKFGIKDDKFYNKDLMRSVLLTSLESYKLAEEHTINLSKGSLGENILMDINPYHLKSGDRIKIGKVLLEITQNCTLCKGLSNINMHLPKLLKNDRGIFAKVINKESEINIGDEVKILN